MSCKQWHTFPRQALRDTSFKRRRLFAKAAVSLFSLLTSAILRHISTTFAPLFIPPLLHRSQGLSTTLERAKAIDRRRPDRELISRKVDLMMTVKNHRTRQFVTVLGISLLTTLVLLGGSTMIHLGMTPFAGAAHAATVHASCASTKGTQIALCEHQDPIFQGCVTDAETLDLQTVFSDPQQTKPLGEVELRYSPTCQTNWIRTTAFATTAGVFKAIHAILGFHDQMKEDIVGIPIVSRLTTYVAWTDMTTAPLRSHAGSGRFDLVGQPQPITVTLQE